jgi:hypothetical protein
VSERTRVARVSKHAYVDARYDPTYAITREELEAIAVNARELRDRVERVSCERIAAMERAAPEG